jgi:very-short-patch-repair endonuclease
MTNTARDAIYLAALRTEWPCVDWIAEHKFHPERKWRFDFAAPKPMVAIEIEGGVWTRGRHSRGAGMVADMRKYNTATALGWKLIRVTPQIFEQDFGAVCKWVDGCLGGLADV